MNGLIDQMSKLKKSECASEDTDEPHNSVNQTNNNNNYRGLLDEDKNH